MRVRQGKKTRGEQKSNCNTGKENMGDGSGEGRGGGGSSEGGQAWFGFLQIWRRGWLDFLGCKFGRGGLGRQGGFSFHLGEMRRATSGSSCTAVASLHLRTPSLVLRNPQFVISSFPAPFSAVKANRHFFAEF